MEGITLPSELAMGLSEEKQHGRTRSVFFVVPVEIRLETYQQVYSDVVVGTPSSRQHVRATWDLANYRKQRQLSNKSTTETTRLESNYESSKTPFALLHTCRTTRTESAPVFQQTVLFHVRNPAHSRWAINSLLLLGQSVTKSIKNVVTHGKEALAFYRVLAEGKLFLPNLKRISLAKGDRTTGDEGHNPRTGQKHSSCLVSSIS